MYPLASDLAYRFDASSSLDDRYRTPNPAARSLAAAAASAVPDSSSIASVTKLAFGGGMSNNTSTNAIMMSRSNSLLPSVSTTSSAPVSAPYHAYHLPAASTPFTLPNSAALPAAPLGSFVGSALAAVSSQPLDLMFNFDFGDHKPFEQSDDLAKAFMEDFMNMPLDLNSAASLIAPASHAHNNNNNNSNDNNVNIAPAPLPPFDPFALPEVLPPEARLASPRQNAASFDQGLESPLGFDSPCSEAAADAFDEDDLDELPPLDFDSFVVDESTLSASVTEDTPGRRAESIVETPLIASAGPSTTSPPGDASPSVTASTASTPAASMGMAPKTRTRRIKATGFRGVHTKLTAIDAPIQQRTYLVPSVTARKRKTTAVERELAKRVVVEVEAKTRSLTPVPIAEEEAEDEEIPEDLVAAVEKKRLQNTLSARKSRQRKQERLAELEVTNQQLLEDNRRLEARVAELEQRLAMTSLF